MQEAFSLPDMHHPLVLHRMNRAPHQTHQAGTCSSPEETLPHCSTLFPAGLKAEQRRH